jgi:branched-subunit amino acid aminotransferase/4-amino-4-deoxychorismate lyase
LPRHPSARDGAIHTPIADCFLNGITRQTVMALAKEQGLEIIERQTASRPATSAAP